MLPAQTLGDFISSQLPGSVIKQWDMAPKSFDFEIIHQETNLQNDLVRLMVINFCKLKQYKFTIDKYLTGTTCFSEGEYTFAITNHSALQVIKVTLIKEFDL